MNEPCIFCQIIRGEIPSLKLYESSKTLAFMDINPASAGHTLIVPKYHSAKLHDIPEDQLSEILPVAQKLAVASGLDNDGPEGPGYNLLQNNGRLAHQMVDHVHFHFVPKRNNETGLTGAWLLDEDAKAHIKEIHNDLIKNMKGITSLL